MKHINALEKVEKYFMKLIPFLTNLSYPERLAALDLEPLELRRLKTKINKLVNITSVFMILSLFLAVSILQ